eukprot:GHVT01055968.1.p3 GENE.GHVT01055968.1~~GHVT01055968.1.p3  ORF type:complete len:104 (-),score=35.57 GHVT01055968.1:339-650(-)
MASAASAGDLSGAAAAAEGRGGSIEGAKLRGGSIEGDGAPTLLDAPPNPIRFQVDEKFKQHYLRPDLPAASALLPPMAPPAYSGYPLPGLIFGARVSVGGPPS